MNFFDLHCDTLSVCYDNKLDITDKSLAASLSGNGIFNNRMSLSAFFIPDNHPTPRTYYRNMYDYAAKQFKKHNVSNCILAVENGNVLLGDISFIKTLYDDGIRSIGLTWNGKNELASGCGETGGLTDKGKEAIDKMNGLGIATDLSHINEQGFYEALDLSKYPICTHTACRIVFEHRRNLYDKQITALKEKDGLIGICLYSEFLGSTDILDGFYAHLSHLLELNCENHVAVGSDFDGCRTLPPLEKDRDIPRLFDYLLSKNIPENILYKTFWENSVNFFTKLLTKQV